MSYAVTGPTRQDRKSHGAWSPAQDHTPADSSAEIPVADNDRRGRGRARDLRGKPVVASLLFGVKPADIAALGLDHRQYLSRGWYSRLLLSAHRTMRVKPTVALRYESMPRPSRTRPILTVKYGDRQNRVTDGQIR